MNKNITLPLLEKIKRANEDISMFAQGDKILVALSGGADSTCLLLALCELSSCYDLTLFALHVNHMIRKDEADRDENFARELCQRLGVTFACEKINVPIIAKARGVSVELCARDERYSALERMCEKYDIHTVATAHNANDNAETILFNLSRGSGTRGLCGIPAKRKLTEKISVVRPLIYVKRSQIEEYLSECGQNFVTDSTNESDDYTRNFVRHKILPLFKELNPSIEESLLRTAKLHIRDDEYLDGVAQDNLTDDLEVLSKLHKAVLSRVIIKLFSKVSSETLPEFHINDLCEKIYEYNGNKGLNRSVSFPDEFFVKIYKGKLKFVKIDRTKSCDECSFFEKLNEGKTFFENSPYALYITFDQSEKALQILEKDEFVYKKVTTNYLYFDTIPQCLYVRNRRAGDKITSGKMNKSLKRLLNMSRYNEWERNALPIVCDEKEILLVPDVALCDNCKKNDNKKVIASVSLYMENQTF